MAAASGAVCLPRLTGSILRANRLCLRRCTPLSASSSFLQVQELSKLMTHRAEDRSERRPPMMAMHFSLLRSGAVILLVTMTMLAGLPARAFADEPKADPSGTATGDKTTAVDAAGNPFVVAEPTDKSAPDY